MTKSQEEKPRINLSSGTPWEPMRGYSRAVVVNDQIFISGTTSVDDRGDVIYPNQPYEQTRYVLNKIRSILSSQGFRLDDVVRTRLFVTNINFWDEYARAHREVFDSIRPASGVVQVTRLTDPRLLIEIEADGIRGLSIPTTIQITNQSR
jgi:enamine deaminase RidA (YjgF/YER057c/UK114 family)